MRPLAPAPTRPSPGSSQPSINLRPVPAKTRSPCVSCKEKRRKCDGKRSSCTECQRRAITCVYDRPEGLTRADQLKAENSALASQVSRLQHVVDRLRSSTDQDAALLLARLRLGDSVDQLANTVAATGAPSPSVISDTITHMTTPGSSFYPEEANIQHFEPGVGLPNMHGDFLHPAFDRHEFGHVPAEVLAEEIDPSAGSVVVLEAPGSQDAEADGADGADGTDGTDGTTGSNITGIKFVKIWSFAVGLQRGIALNPPQPSRHNLRIHPNILGDHGKVGSPGTIPRSLFVPRWSMMVAHSDFDGTLHGFLSGFLVEARARLQDASTPEDVFGTHAHIGALFDKDEFEKAPPLSQWATRVVHSIVRDQRCMTSFGSMYVLFWVARWMIMPTEEYFNAIPSWMRPTPNQFFMPHPMILDFLIWPALRDYVVQFPSLHVGMDWLVVLCDTITCAWPGTVGEALCRDEITGITDLTPVAKNVAGRLESWSLGSTFIPYMTNAESLVSIRPV
ncbi:hypothetical protein QBC40DRAFT_282353 [Triangularia verruculosa]|uniref:Zn(2)-C6 fungal-type domain-containing protein n=1 Tax=Triangularia verruculosa TaxID=2587418 RepID=A0AAN6XFG2_9PEZI|nr:hypothetical protein QBC40DRAFT_282353 [Triangularia verruculosa]